MRRFFKSHDTLAIIALILLWMLFFWRLLTPVQADQASLVNGDFSGQFVAFAAYQYDRFVEGEVPLWNPYNNGGLPFIGDTQAAVFYPPRLATIAVRGAAGDWNYHALELEMMAHVLLFTLLMYGFVRRLTWEQPGSAFGGFIAAVVGGYGGFFSGYPQLQLAILEAGIWLPLAALGILEATRYDRLRWLWLVLTGFATGLSWMAGHPQTSWFLTYFLVAYFGYQVYQQRYGWRIFIGGTALFGLISTGVAAVQLLPAAEYLGHTARPELGFDAKGNGFPVQDVVQFLFPGVASFFSPLYVGIIGLGLALIALWRRLPGVLFWGAVVLVALGLSFGANTAIFHAFYNVLPGLRFFRGQERAAYLVAHALAVLAGLGATHLFTWDKLRDFQATRRIRQALLFLLILCAIISALVLLMWSGSPDTYGRFVTPFVFSTIIAGLFLFALPFLLDNPSDWRRLILIAGLLVFELFTINMDNSNYQPVPPQWQLSMTPPPLVAQVLEDTAGIYRVDGWRGLTDNYGSLYGLYDLRGISPLFLNGPYTLIYRDYVYNPLAWELFAVRYVFSERDRLDIDSTLVNTGTDRDGVVYLHRLEDPRPFAWLVYAAEVVDSDTFAYALLDDPRFDARHTVILNTEPGIALPDSAPDDAQAAITEFLPERMTIEVNTATNAILTLAHADYPGWQATLDDEPTAILRAYGATTAIVIPEGQHTVQLVYDPISYRVGAILSLVTWGALGILGIVLIIRRVLNVSK